MASTDPFSVAEVAARLEAAPVTTPGGDSVVNVPSRPLAVPSLFVASTRYVYVVPGVRPVSFVETATSALPEPMLVLAVLVSFDGSDPYSKKALVDLPPGLTVPLTRALVGPICCAAPVIAVGAAACVAPAGSASATAAIAAAAVRCTILRVARAIPETISHQHGAFCDHRVKPR